MIDTEFSFGDSPWELFLRSKRPGEKVAAGNLLAMLEGEDEDAVEDAFAAMESVGLELDVSDLPRTAGSGEATARLRQEMTLAKKGLEPGDLPENDPLRLYLEELAATPATGDERLLAMEAAEGSEDAWGQLTNLGLSRVLTLAKEYVGYGVLLLDLIQEGSLGLWQGVCQYRSGEYTVHRDRWIRLYMAKAVALQARANGIGGKLRSALEDYRGVDERLLMELGRNPTLEEMAEAMHMSMEEITAVKKMLTDAQLLAGIKKAPEPEEEEQSSDQAVENTPEFQMRQRILDLLAELEPEDAELLTLRFGLEGKLPMTPEETGAKLGLAPETVMAREAAALAKLRTKR